MAFTEITVLEVDYAHMQECSENEVIVPYILSNIPPGEWKNYFEIPAPPRPLLRYYSIIE